MSDLSIDALLEKAKAVYWRGRSQYRDALLETGSLLHEFFLAYLRQGDALSEAQRLREGFTHRQAVQKAASGLETSTSNICRLVSTAMTVALLSDDGRVGKLAWGTLHQFSRFVRRRPSKHPGRNGGLASEVEAWEVKAKFGEKAVKLFRRAVADNLEYKEVVAAVLRLYGGADAQRACPARRKRQREETSALSVLQTVAIVASPGDVAEMCIEIIKKADSPSAVALFLRARLEQFLPQKARFANTGA